MLRDTDGGAHTATEAARIVAFDRARTFITLMVVVHHSVVNFTHFGNGDRMRWLGFDLMVLFNDSYFMAFMFLISGLFVHESLTRRGAVGISAPARLPSWRAAPDLDLRADPDRLLRLVPALSYARHDRLQLLPLLVAHDHGRAVAVGTVVVPVGAARLRHHRGCDLGDGAEDSRGLGPADCRLARAADDGLCRLPDPFDRGLCADASGGRRWRMVRARATIRFRSRPAASCSTPLTSSPASASA